jgi:hypothetical protein
MAFLTASSLWREKSKGTRILLKAAGVIKAGNESGKINTLRHHRN